MHSKCQNSVHAIPWCPRLRYPFHPHSRFIIRQESRGQGPRSGAEEERMPTDVIMPQMGESIFEGTITKWLKQPGDAVQKDEPLLEISTDKVDAEIPSPVAGVLTEIKIAEGATVQVNTVIAVIGESGSASTQASVQDPAPSQMAQVEVVMPQMGESIFEGTITKWLKKPGDPVQKDEPLLEISTDKVDAEIPSPAAGVLTEIKIAEGATVQVNTVIALIGGSASAQQSVQKSAPPQVAAAAPAAPAHQRLPQVPRIWGPGTTTQTAEPAAPQAPGRLLSSPLARRIAKEHNIDIRRIAGTGTAGRITKEDVLRALASPATVSPATPTAEPAPGLSSLPTDPVPLTRMRAIIAGRMVESVRIAPHVHTVYKVDMTRIARLRDQHRAAFEQRHGVKLTYMPFIAAAAIAALRRFPIINASLETTAQGLAVRYHQNIHLGIAVALDWGLIVPVIRQAEQRSFADVARLIADLALRARHKKLSPDETGGSTFTLTNAGAFGGEFGLPILNQPESAILAVGGLRKEPAVLTDAEGNDTIAIRSMQYFCLGFDHRLIDGADGGKFMLEFKRVLETWNQDIG
jgi:pyruvate dehydrogenase E2 component (dihydrolipoyllysine-residue acetyltransferase)